MASWKRVKEESVKDLGMLLMVDDDDRSTTYGGMEEEEEEVLAEVGLLIRRREGRWTEELRPFGVWCSVPCRVSLWL
ncbi:hypothetical protein NL676_017867 [Syzygium grande]|nr:hypothetical protein NL676_017867 [Syzygium grande]